MACGLPAVAFSCDYGPGEIIREGVDGLLVPPGNINSLAGAMQRLFSDEKLRIRMARKAPDVLDRFSMKAVLDRWEELFEQVIQRRI